MRYCALCLLFFFLSCFDYKEILIINPDFSGRIQIEYQTPVLKKRNKSIISFLPATKEEYRKFYGVDPEYFETNIVQDITENIAYVSVKLEYPFRSLSEMESKLYGDVKIIYQQKEVVLQRTFSVLTAKNLEDPFFSFFYTTIYDLIRNRYLRFQIHYPAYYEITSNYGGIPSTGVLTFQFPLEKTLTGKNAIKWIVIIRSNPVP